LPPRNIDSSPHSSNGQSLGAALSTGSDAGADPGKKRDTCQKTRKKKELCNEINGIINEASNEKRTLKLLDGDRIKEARPLTSSARTYGPAHCAAIVECHFPIRGLVTLTRS
jgi:hypothetical protein